jgi:hypothetical protein
VLSPEDVSIPGVIVCTPITVDDWLADSLRTAEAAARIIRWLRGR